MYLWKQFVHNKCHIKIINFTGFKRNCNIKLMKGLLLKPLFLTCCWKLWLITSRFIIYTNIFEIWQYIRSWLNIYYKFYVKLTMRTFFNVWNTSLFLLLAKFCFNVFIQCVELSLVLILSFGFKRNCNITFMKCLMSTPFLLTCRKLWLITSHYIIYTHKFESWQYIRSWLNIYYNFKLNSQCELFLMLEFDVLEPTILLFFLRNFVSMFSSNI